MTLVVVLLCMASPSVAGVEEHAGHPPAATPGQPEAEVPAAHETRTGSGTAWQPEATPMYAIHRASGRWGLMLHANAFLLYDEQTGPRGATRVVAPNWVMAMERRRLGQGSLLLTQMFSLDPATVRPRGYPELFQVGETFRGRPLVDAQHPHDLYMALSAEYDQPITRRLQGFLYVAPVGEPALGPVAYPHRLSAWENPFAPLGHHWQDSTHITFGVLTGGLQSQRWRLEGSWFNGREPDENRWDFDPIRLNSTSLRAQYLLGRQWHIQVSRGWLKEPEALEPGNVTRTTASVTRVRPWADGYCATSLVWGQNQELESGRTDVFGWEGALNWRSRNTFYWRYENADREGLFTEGPEHDQVLNVNAFTLGYTRDLNRGGSWSLGLGGSLTLFAKPDSLDAAHGRFPLGVLLYLRLHPSRMMHGAAGPSEHGM